MYRNENWEAAKTRYNMWWEQADTDRPVLRVCAPKEGARRKVLFHEHPSKEKWHDPEYMVAAQKDAIACTYFGGEAFGWFFPNLGTDMFNAFLGADIQYTEFAAGHPPWEYTAWTKPFVEDWANHSFFFDAENEMFKRALRLVNLALDEANDEYIVGFPDIIGGIDCLSAMRGAENFCLDLFDCPDAVKEKIADVRGIFKEVYNRLHHLLHSRQGCAPATIPLWHRGRYFTNINDFTYNISPELYKEFVLPDLIDEMNFLDASVYHLDGPGALCHLDLLLSLPELNAIQWTPGAGNEGAAKWMPLYKKIQEAGKSVYMYCATNELELVLNELSPNGLLIDMYCESESDARGVVEMASEISFKKGYY